MKVWYSSKKPNESGWYYHRNGHGHDEIVLIEWAYGVFWVKKIGRPEYPLEDDKGQFGPRIRLPGED